MPQRLDRFHVIADGNIVSAKYMNGYEGYGTRINLGLGVNGASTTGGVSLSKQLALNTKNGLVVAEATQKISARQIAKGIATVASGPLGLALLAAPVILDLLDDSGLDVQDGQIVGPAPGQYQSSGTYWRASNGSTIGDAWTPPEACKIVISTLGGAYTGYLPAESRCTGTKGGFPLGANVNPHPSGNPYPCASGAWVNGSTCSSSPATAPVTPQAIEDAITAQNPGAEVLKELADKGGHAPDPDPADTPKVQNPVQSQDKTTTKTNPDGSTETTVCRTSGTVVGDNLKLTEQCTITARDPAGNTTSTTTTNTDDAAPQAGSEQSMFCTLFPDILACAKFGEAEEEVPRSTREVTFSEENLFGGGTCPTDQTFTFKGSTIPITNYAQACDLLQTYVRPLAILLAFFTGLMIIARGMPE